VLKKVGEGFGDRELGVMSSQGTSSLHDVRFPGESDEYRRAREELLKAEIELRRQLEAVAAQTRRLPLGGSVPTDCIFEEWDPDTEAARPVQSLRTLREREGHAVPLQLHVHPR
jgi:predicted dithiol-disulfide oxidoreductase (DUF899 family)